MIYIPDWDISPSTKILDFSFRNNFISIYEVFKKYLTKTSKIMFIDNLEY